ncbi:type II secretion system protein [Cellulomonas denverensis]|uniref:type II secretion system protein n=1 Tax=Cellulomonas denverensis TaxID=264297 RepID=UPI001941887A|nr:type II secretion system protein [Cellulomonas denverensis]GIG24243.1 hypothetical protein Cde04nite_04870 [Cellulomonas denverensis]
MVRIVRRRVTGDQGATLLEVVIACVLLGIMAAAVMTIVLQSQRAGLDNRNRVAAANLAAREIDIVREEFGRSDSAPVTIANAGTQVNARPLTDGTAGQPLVVDGTSFTVTTAVQWNITGSGQSACDGGSIVDYPTLGVTVTVTWSNMGSTRPVVNSTQLAPPKGTGVPTTDSFVAVKVTDQTGAANVGRGVKVTGNGTTRSGTTDADGCAVIQVSPNATAGTAYTAQVTDTDYVDISGTATPSKAVGTVKQGQLNNNVIFQVAKAGTVNLHLVDESGNPLPAGGAQLTLVASESSGTTGSRTVPAQGPITPVEGLWPTTYGAYVGTSAPAAGYPTGTLTAGGTLDLYVTLTPARVSFTNLPAGTTALFAGPTGTTSCTASGVQQIDPNGASLLPGEWDFFVTGTTFDCSPGPASLTLVSGENGQRSWGTTTLRVNGAPSGVLWALNRSKITGSVTTCPGPGYEAVTVNVDAARSGPLALPAGDWFVYVTTGQPGSGCVGVPSGQYSTVIDYDTDTVLTWVVKPASVTVDKVTNSNQTQVWATTAPLNASCTNTPSGTQLTRSGTKATGTLDGGTWYIYQRNTNSRTCTLGGTIVVGGQTSYTLTFNSTSPGTVGP